MTTNTSSRISEFAKDVRRELADLPRNEIKELTDGLEADLYERLEEEGDGIDFGSPAAYAAELRDAAGIEPKSTRRSAFSSELFIQNLQSWFNRTAVGRAIFDFAVSIRPLWWVARAAVAWWVLVGVFYTAIDGLILLPILVFLSIQWGRKKWFTGKFFAAILLPLNLLAIVLLFPAQAMTVVKLQNYANAEAMMQAWPATDGLRYDGEKITDLKAFDDSGEQIDGLTFKDQNGKFLEIPATAGAYYQVPDIIGMSVQEANLAFSQSGIPAVDFEYLDGANDQNGVVVEVGPASAGEMVSEFDVVTVTIGLRGTDLP
ncbi:MAG: hypothetical protein RL174_336 [Actinomycetota bacterium]|jgi:hypothetical protein